MLTAAELTAMRTDAAASLPGTAILSRASGTADGMGGSTLTWAAAGTVACRVEPSTTEATESESGGRSVNASTWWLHVPWDTDLRVSDRVAYDSASYEVVQVLSPRSWEVLTRAEVVLVR